MDRVPPLNSFNLPILSTAHLIFILTNWPGVRDTELIMDLLCTRDLRAALRYLLSLPFSHTPRPVLKSLLRQRFRWVHVHELKELATLFPQLSALVETDDGVLVPMIGPLTDLESGLWDSSDFFSASCTQDKWKVRFSCLFPGLAILCPFVCLVMLNFISYSLPRLIQGLDFVGFYSAYISTQTNFIFSC